MNLFEIPAHLPFLDALAQGVVRRAATLEDPAALARTTILLPTRRAARSLRESFLRASGQGALLLPRLRPLAGLSVEDAEELSLPALMDLPPAVDPARRLAVLTAMVLRLPPHFGGPSHPDQAWRLAVELATLLDEMALEGCDPTDLPGLVPEGLAQHWEVTHRFLAGVVEAWNGWLDEQGLMDIGPRRIAAIRAQTEAWAKTPPADLVVAAGIGVGGTIPAAAELLRVLAGCRNGAVVLHGAGEALPNDLWEALHGSHTHPMGGQIRLLQLMRATAADLQPWPCDRPADPAGEARGALLARALRPAEGIDCWQDKEPARWAPALEGLSVLNAPDETAEAAAVALLLREALETPGARAALVTPDRDLARRVCVELARHGVLADDSAGQPLGQTPAGSFLRLLARMVAEDFAPVPTLACLKHPLCAAGRNRADWMRAVRELEKYVLRGPRPAGGLPGLRAAAAAAFAEPIDQPEAEPEHRRTTRLERRRRAATLLEALQGALGRFDALPDQPRPPADMLADHLAAAEALAGTDAENGGLRLYSGEEGEPLAVHLASLGPAMDCLTPVSAAAWPALFDALLEGPLAPGVRNMRGRVGGSHPRVQVLGLLEARLQSFDRVVLGALEESVWPIATDPGAWMSRPMRRQFGLPEPEARIGRVAADFVLSALSAPQAILSRARKRGGSPTVAARWLTRIETFLSGQAEGMTVAASPAIGWAAALDAPARVVPCDRPRPAPPVHLRPRRLTVTDVWDLKADPYAWYGKRMLNLRALEELDAEASGADYGSIVHDAVAAWTRRAAAEPGGFSSAKAAEWFAAAAEDALRRHAPRPGLVAFWRPRLARIGEFLLETERGRTHVAARHPELSGAVELRCGVRLEGRADRVDVLRDGSLAILDFKTGEPPSNKAMQNGSAPQMPLEAAIARRGGFPGITADEVSALEHWRLAGGYESGKVHAFRPDKDADIGWVADDALRSVDALAESFLLSSRPFLARPHPGRAPRGSDYDHLSRLREWGGAEEGVDG
ncbi:double-strand break repair protein AddB [Roseomonas sp. BN140053]|uniref:double-strand break repair protein AddB n=1 Tax=Roseomonas sp. BN140053 TaxID=3391898 RepID=UPI0039E859CB